MRTIKFLLALFLSNPFIFNATRRLIAGDQSETKKFVRDNLIRYRAKTILDVGCGTGDFVEAVPKECKYLGIDFNKQFISYAGKIYGRKNAKFLFQDVTDKNFYQKKSFDAVLLISMLHHLSDKELEEILPIVKRITKKIVIIADIIPDPSGILRKTMVKIDQGRFVRTKEEKIKIVGKYFNVIRNEIILSRLAIQFGIICKP